MFKFALAAILVAHGIGHSMGLLQLFRVATINPEWHGESWLFTGGVGTSVAQAFAVVAWTVAIIGFVAVGAVIWGWLPASWWAPLAIGSAAASIAGLALFPTAFPPFSSIAALVVDVVLLGAVLVVHWAPEQLAP
jgi:hypothetical protein